MTLMPFDVIKACALGEESEQRANGEGVASGSSSPSEEPSYLLDTSRMVCRPSSGRSRLSLVRQATLDEMDDELVEEQIDELLGVANPSEESRILEVDELNLSIPLLADFD